MRGEDNPADLASRVAKMLGPSIWWKEHSWLSKEESFWENKGIQLPREEELPENAR